MDAAGAVVLVVGGAVVVVAAAMVVVSGSARVVEVGAMAVVLGAAAVVVVALTAAVPVVASVVVGAGLLQADAAQRTPISRTASSSMVRWVRRSASRPMTPPPSDRPATSAIIARREDPAPEASERYKGEGHDARGSRDAAVFTYGRDPDFPGWPDALQLDHHEPALPAQPFWHREGADLAQRGLHVDMPA